MSVGIEHACGLRPGGQAGMLGHVYPQGGGDVPPRGGVHLYLRER